MLEGHSREDANASPSRNFTNNFYSGENRSPNYTYINTVQL